VTVRLGLASLCALLVDELRADACAISRVLGDVLIQVGEHVPHGGTLNTGQGYLASDFPLTVEVLRDAAARRVWASDLQADADEVRLLRALGYEGLLMLPLVLQGRVWGLVEVYRRGSGFSDEESAYGERILGEALAEAAAWSSTPVPD
jgi:GAF domain-containing protein